MKKLCIVACLCITLFTHAATKKDLDKAVRSLDVRTVEQIIAKEHFTLREFDSYCILAQEVVNNREIWVLRRDYDQDVTTPCDIPSSARVALEGYIAAHGLLMGLYCGLSLLGDSSDKEMHFVGTVLGLGSVGKFFYDACKRHVNLREQKELLRKKYDDAVTIRQLIFAADLVEA